jgi:hypothetical protein
MNTAQATKSRSWLLASSILDIGCACLDCYRMCATGNRSESMSKHAE